jgi:hypothetical protein
MCVCVCVCQEGTAVPDLHTRRPLTHSDIYQKLYWYSWFSWRWARGCSKHVEDWNKHISKKNLRQVGHLPELYRDARSTEQNFESWCLSTNSLWRTKDNHLVKPQANVPAAAVTLSRTGRARTGVCAGITWNVAVCGSTLLGLGGDPATNWHQFSHHFTRFLFVSVGILNKA